MLRVKAEYDYEMACVFVCVCAGVIFYESNVFSAILNIHHESCSQKNQEIMGKAEKQNGRVEEKYRQLQ